MKKFAMWANAGAISFGGVMPPPEGVGSDPPPVTIFSRIPNGSRKRDIPQRCRRRLQIGQFDEIVMRDVGSAAPERGKRKLVAEQPLRSCHAIKA